MVITLMQPYISVLAKKAPLENNQKVFIKELFEVMNANRLLFCFSVVFFLNRLTYILSLCFRE